MPHHGKTCIIQIKISHHTNPSLISQAGNYSFNRAQLLNIGFLESLNISDFECFVFHDVDHILENDKNDYGCPESPKLLGVSVDRFRRRYGVTNLVRRSFF